MQLVGKTFRATAPDGTNIVIFVTDRIHVDGCYYLRFQKNGRMFSATPAAVRQAIRMSGAVAAGSWAEGRVWMEDAIVARPQPQQTAASAYIQQLQRPLVRYT